MGKLEIFDIILDKPGDRAVFVPGETVTGHVVLQLSDVMKMRGLRIKFHGGARVHWTERHVVGTGKAQRTVTRHYHNNQLYFNRFTVLYGKAPEGKSGPDPEHPTGRYQYPFQFTLSEALPSSFEGPWGQVRFWLEAVIEKPWKYDHKTKKPFTVLSSLDLNRLANTRDPQRGQAQKSLCCMCCKSGPISASLHLDRRGYVPGEFITVNGEVLNHTNRTMSSSSIQLQMITVFRATNKSRTHQKVVSQIKKGEIGAGGSELWSGERLYVPPLPPSQLPHCDIINIIYKVVMVVAPSGPTFQLLEAPVKVVIGTLPLQNVQYVFANEPQAYRLPACHLGGEEEGEAREEDWRQAEDLPPPPAYSVHPVNQGPTSAPPPSYAECALGKVDLHEEGDSEYTRGEMNWAPSYPYYTWDNK